MSDTAQLVELRAEDVDRFISITRQLQESTGKTLPAGLAAGGDKLAFALSRRLKKHIPTKGSIRIAGLYRFRTNGGIRVRESAMNFARARTVATQTDIKTRKGSHYMEASRSKGLPGLRLKRKARSWWQIAVERELSMRESGRGYTSYAARVRGVKSLGDSGRAGGHLRHLGRYHQGLAEADLKMYGSQSFALTFEWGTDSRSEIGESMNQPKSKGEIPGALIDAAKETEDKMARSIAADLKRAGL